MAEVVTAMPLQDRPAELADLPEAAIREYLDLGGCGTSTRHAEGPTDGKGHEMTAKPKAGSWWDRHQALHPQIALRKSGILNIAPRLLVEIVNIASLCAAVTGR